MAQDTEFQQRIQRISVMVSELESTADPSSRKLAKDLIEALMALHSGSRPANDRGNFFFLDAALPRWRALLTDLGIFPPRRSA